MYLSKLYYIWNSGKYMAECQCDKCDSKPAVQLMADCNGDALTLCKDCWKKWYDNELMVEFNKDVLQQYKIVENPPKQYVESGNIYE